MKMSFSLRGDRLRLRDAFSTRADASFRRKRIEDLTDLSPQGGASRGSKLAPCSFYLVSEPKNTKIHPLESVMTANLFRILDFGLRISGSAGLCSLRSLAANSPPLPAFSAFSAGSFRLVAAAPDPMTTLTPPRITRMR
jgi:hypothetical protein